MESLSSLVQSPLFSPIAATIFTVAAISLFWWRVGTIHSVLDRLWRLIAGSADVQDEVLQSLLQRNRDLEKFRFVYGIKAERLCDIHTFSAWLDSHGIDVSRIQRVRPWVDIKSAEVVVQPPPHYRRKRFLLVIVAILIMLGLNSFDISRYAYLQMRESGTWFKTNGNVVQTPSGDWSLSTDECATGNVTFTAKLGFASTELDVLCAALKDGSLKELSDRTIRQQTWIRAVGILILILIVGMNLFAIAAATEASRLRKLLYGPGEDDATTSNARDS